MANKQAPEIRMLRLDDLTTNHSQYGLTAHSKESGRIRYLRISDITDDGKLKNDELRFVDIDEKEFNKYKLEKDDLLIARSGSVGRTYLVEDNQLPQVFASYLIRFKLDKNKAIPKYVFYYTLSKTFKEIIEKKKKIVAQPNINAKEYSEIKIPILSLKTQQEIVKVLELTSNLKQKREQANQMANKLLQAVFMQMFGNKPTKNTIGDVAEFISSGSTPFGGKKTYLSEGIMFIRSQNVYMNEFRLDDVAYISEETHQRMKRTWLKNDDVLLNITGASLGRVVVYKGETNKANVNQHVCIIRVDRSKALPEFVSHYLSMPISQREIWTNQAGASRQALNFQQIKKLTLLLPTLEEQKRFVTIVNKVDSLIEKQQRSTKEITSLFNSLTAKAFSGLLN